MILDKNKEVVHSVILHEATIDKLYDAVVIAKKNNATNLSIREDRSQSAMSGFYKGHLYGVFIDFYRELTPEEVRENKIKDLKSQIAILELEANKQKKQIEV